jgi:O-antigen/teichoic acid export membrane protein
MSVARHTSYNLLGTLTPVFVSFVTVPLYLELIGIERYGLLALCWLLIGYFGQFDLGVGRATAQQIAALHERGDDDRSQAFWTGAVVSGALAVLTLIIAVPLAPALLNQIGVSSLQLRGELMASLPLLILCVPLSICQSVLRGALEGRRAFLAINLLVAAAAVATGILPLGAILLWGPSLPHLIAATFLVRLVLLISLAVTCRRLVPVGPYERPTRERIRPVLRFGAWLTVSNIVGPLMVMFDRFLIGAVIGAAAVGIYTVPFNLIAQLLVVPAALANALFPRMAAYGPGGIGRLAFLSTACLITPTAVLGIFVVGPFLSWWVGSAVGQQSTELALILIIGGWANALAQIPYASLQAQGRTDSPAKAHLAELLPYLAALWLGLSHYGVAGAAIAWSARSVVDLAVLGYLSGIARHSVRSIALQGAVVAAVAAYVVVEGPSLPAMFVALLGVSLLAALMLRSDSELLDRLKLGLARRAL